MNGIQRYTINLIENEIDQSCPYIENYKMPDGKWCKYSDVEAALSASPWTPVSDFEEIPEGEWLVKFTDRKDPDKPGLVAVCLVRSNIATIGDAFAFDRTPYYQVTKYMEIPA